MTEDILGLFADFKPKFVKRYAELGEDVATAAAAYAADVREGRFPGPEHCFQPRTPSLATTSKAESPSWRKRA